MVKLYKVCKEKTEIKGFWKDENGKVYIDNIKIIPIHSIGKFEFEKDLLFREGEKAIFYTVNNQAYIETEKGEITILKKRIAYHEKELNKNYINTLLNNHEGFTAYKTEKGFLIEIWK